MTNTELYHFGVKGMRWGHRKARPRMSGAARSARRKKILKRVAIGAGAAAGAAALGYGAYKYGKNPANIAKLDVRYRNAKLKAGNAADMVRAHGGPIGAARELHRRHNTPMAKAQREIKRMQRGDRLHDAASRVANVGAQAKYLGVRGSARFVGQKGAAAASAGAKTAGGYVLGGKHSKTRANIRGAGEKLKQARAAADTLVEAQKTRRKYQGKHAAHFAYDSPGEALYHFALDPYGRYAIL